MKKGKRIEFEEGKIIEAGEVKILLDEEFVEKLWNIKVLKGKAKIINTINKNEIFTDSGLYQDIFTIEEENLEILIKNI